MAKKFMYQVPVDGYMTIADYYAQPEITAAINANVVPSGAVASVAGKTGVVTLVKADVGLANVDNTTDLLKPVSTATTTALGLKANLAAPTFTGVPLAPTAAASTNTTQIATTAFVKSNLGAAAVVDATDAATVITQFNALLASLRAKGIILP